MPLLGSILKEFDPAEPRDEDGKWTAGGGGGKRTRSAPGVRRKKLADDKYGGFRDVVRIEGGEDFCIKAAERYGLMTADVKQYRGEGDVGSAMAKALKSEVERRPDVKMLVATVRHPREYAALEKEFGEGRFKYGGSRAAMEESNDPVEVEFWVRPNVSQTRAAAELRDHFNVEAHNSMPGYEARTGDYVKPSDAVIGDIDKALADSWGSIANPRKPNKPIRMVMTSSTLGIGGQASPGFIELNVPTEKFSTPDFAVGVAHEYAHTQENDAYEPEVAELNRWMKERAEEFRESDGHIPWSDILSGHGNESNNRSHFSEDWAISAASYVLAEPPTKEQMENAYWFERRDGYAGRKLVGGKPPMLETVEKVAELLGKPMRWAEGEREAMPSFVKLREARRGAT